MRVPVGAHSPAAAWEALDLSRLWRFRDLLLALAVRDIKLRYRQTLLGVLWVVLQPLLGAGIFAFVFGRVAQLDSGGAPYVLFAYAGLLAWNLFNGVVLKAAGSLVANAPLVAKVFFPRLLLPFSGVVSTLLDFAIALVVGSVLFSRLRASTPGLRLLLAPFWLVMLLLLATGLGPALRRARRGVSRRHPHPARRAAIPALRQPGRLHDRGDSRRVCRACSTS